MNYSSSVPEPSPELINSASDTRNASASISQSSNKQRQDALMAMAESLLSSKNKILNANNKDLERSKAEGLSSSLLARLKLILSQDFDHCQKALYPRRLFYHN